MTLAVSRRLRRFAVVLCIIPSISLAAQPLDEDTRQQEEFGDAMLIGLPLVALGLTYGWSWGVPAYLAASFVGFTRVQSDEHYTHDVLVGAAIGILSNYDFGHFNIPFGALTIAPMLTAPSVPDYQPWRETLGEPWEAAPGLRIKLSF